VVTAKRLRTVVAATLGAATVLLLTACGGPHQGTVHDKNH